MLKLDINGLSNDEVIEAVHYYCCQFGEVDTLKLVRPSGQTGVAYAIVQMKEPEQHRIVAARIGDREKEGCVIIRVEQEIFDLRRSPSLAGIMRLPPPGEVKRVA